MFSLATIFAFAISVVAAVWWLYFKSTRFYKLCVKIPGPPPYPIIGNIYDILKQKELTLQKFSEFSEKFYPMCRVFVGSKCFVLLHDANDIKTVLYSRKTISKSVAFEAVVCRVFGNSLLTAPRDQWKKYRRIMKPAFNTEVVRGFLDVFNRKSEVLVEKLKQAVSDEIDIDAYLYLSMLTLDILTKASFGVDMNIQENDKTDFVLALKSGEEIVQKCVSVPVYWRETFYRFSSLRTYADNVRKTLYGFVNDVIRNKAEYYNNNTAASFDDDNTEANNKLGFLDYVFKISQGKDQVFTEEELRNQVLVLALGGTDTSAFTVSVCLKLLGLHKDIQDKVVEELCVVFADDFYRKTGHEDIQRMTYTEQVIKETMRLFPVLFLTGRRVEEDIEVGGYVFPAGTDIGISPYMVHRNPRYYPDPLKFDPERFSAENCKSRIPCSYIPFLAGPRICIGHHYALVQMKIVLSYILRHFEILPCGTREELEDVDMQGVLVLKHGYNVRMRLRKWS